MKAKFVKKSVETQNESLGVLGILSIMYLSWLGLKKLLKIILNKTLRKVISGTLGGLEYVKINMPEKFKEEIKILELNDRYKISIPDGLRLSFEESTKSITILEIMLYKKSKEILVKFKYGEDKTTKLIDTEYEQILNIIQSESEKM